jgi:formylglycine-generating enzyme required for sulfatase activity
MSRPLRAGASSAPGWFSRAMACAVLVLDAVFAFGSFASAADFEEVTLRDIVFVRIPAGSFTIGATDEVQAQLKATGDWTRFEQCERPAHVVAISKPFLIGKYEITQKQWAAVMGKKNAPFAFKGENLPVESVSWSEAQNFLAALNKLEGKVRFRLPTEAEWEYCCRAGSVDAYGLAADNAPITRENLADYAWFSVNSGNKTHPVGTRKPNAWGLYDMQGNVWEWVADWYGASFYTAAPQTDPQNKDSLNCTERVFRGGSWVLTAPNLRASFRGAALPGAKSAYVGFRAVCEP